LAVGFVYVIAFRGGRFVMVRHQERAWEMPGGRIEPGETPEQAAVREFSEETGARLTVLGSLDVPGGKVFVGTAGDRVAAFRTGEIAEVRDFRELPGELSFPLVEYQALLAQASSLMETFK